MTVGANGAREAESRWGLQGHGPYVVLMVLAMFYAVGLSIPTGNEYLYLLRLARQWNPQFLLNDWTFSQPAPEHFVFNAIFGILFRFLPIPVAGTICHGVTWTLLSIGLLRLGRRLGLPAWASCAAILLWVAVNQALVAQEWMLGGFEAKCVAYICLLFALDRFLGDKPLSASLLLGLVFSFHPAVGMWSILGLAPALLLGGLPFPALLRAAALVTAGALPGLIPALGAVLHGGAEDPALWKFMVLLKMPFHLDPMSWKKFDIATLYLAFACNAVHALRFARGERASLFLFRFEAALCLFFTAGVALRLAHLYGPLKFMPFRLFAVFTPLFFLFRVFAALRSAAQGGPLRETRAGQALLLFSVVALMSFPNPISGFSALHTNQKYWHKDDGLRPALAWLAANTPNGSIAALPPWRHDTWYLGRRAQVACYPFHPYDRLGEWKERIETMVGPITEAKDEAKFKIMEERYRAMPDSTVRLLGSKYGARYLVTTGEYGYPVLFQGVYKVYAIPATSPDGK